MTAKELRRRRERRNILQQRRRALPGAREREALASRKSYWRRKALRRWGQDNLQFNCGCHTCTSARRAGYFT